MTQSLVITNILLGWLKDTAREAKHIMSSCKSLPRRNLNVTLSEVLKAFHVEIPHLTEFSNWILQKVLKKYRIQLPAQSLTGIY